MDSAFAVMLLGLLYKFDQLTLGPTLHVRRNENRHTWGVFIAWAHYRIQIEFGMDVIWLHALFDLVSFSFVSGTRLRQQDYT